MSKRSSDLLIADIKEAIEKISSYIHDLDETAFLSNQLVQDAVVRNLEIIGEASNRLPDDFKKSHQDISWHEIIGLRHRIVHDYFGIDMRLVWTIISKDLPILKSKTLFRS